MNDKKSELEARKYLWSKLEYGDMRRIADFAGVSYTTVLRFFKGETNNVEIQKAVLALFKEKERLIKKLYNL